MSDKPTRDKAIDKAIKQGATEAAAVGVVTFLSVQYPDLFAPKPDPVEEFIALVCSVCSYEDECGIRINCGSKREALRAYVADLRKRAEGK